jgi:hypothetical protein
MKKVVVTPPSGAVMMLIAGVLLYLVLRPRASPQPRPA